MSVFFKRASDRICKYQRKYIHHPRFAALKLAIWSLGELLKNIISINLNKRYLSKIFFKKHKESS